MNVTVPVEVVKSKVYLIRGLKVLLDSDLAALYRVETRRLNEQVNRNRTRFPDDFMFQLNNQEFASLMSQFATSNPGRGGRRKLPYAFTEQGVGDTQNWVSLLRIPRLPNAKACF